MINSHLSVQLMPVSNKRNLQETSPEFLSTRKKISFANMTVANMSIADLKNFFEEILTEKIKELKMDFDRPLNEIKSLQTLNETLSNEIEHLKNKNKMEHLEKRLKQTNVIFSVSSNMCKNGDAHTIVNDLAKRNMNLANINLEEVISLPSKGQQQLIMVDTKNKAIVNQLLKNSRLLKGTGVYVNPDYTKDELKRR